MSLDVIFAYVVGMLAGVAIIGALAFALVWEWCAIRHTLAAHRRQAPDPSFSRDRARLPARFRSDGHERPARLLGSCWKLLPAYRPDGGDWLLLVPRHSSPSKGCATCEGIDRRPTRRTGLPVARVDIEVGSGMNGARSNVGVAGR